jgi:triosephosphate isomerase
MHTRQKLIVGNWKMNTLNLAEAETLARGVLHGAEHIERITTVICPPTIWIAPLSHELPKLPHFALGAQNVYSEESGAFTGETSPKMLRGLVEYIIIGHSERTHIFKESMAMVAAKVAAALENGFTPILCVGEDEMSDQPASHVAQRLNHLVSELAPMELEHLVVAYEPVWAIGSGTPATPDYAETVLAALRQVTSPKTRLLYGGSVNEQNAPGFLSLKDCDGLLIGGTSLKLKPFLTICQQADDLAQANGHPSLHPNHP